MALETVEKQKANFRQWGILGDWEKAYRTLDPAYEVKQLDIFWHMFRSGLIYTKCKPVYWSPSMRTALAEAELEYKDDHVSRSAYVRMKLVGDGVPDNAYALIWTTTPWTLPANQAIAVHATMEYVLARAGNEAIYLVARNRLKDLEDIVSPRSSLEVVSLIQGQQVASRWKYVHPFVNTDAKPIITADFVTDDSGTGLVHTASGHGMEDYDAGLSLGLEPFSPGMYFL